MANEKRLIDANKVINAMQKCIDDAPFAKGTITYSSFEAIIECLKQEPTVDAVEVVRCKNCRDCEMGYPEKRLDREATQAWLCKRYKMHRKPDDFCSYGERREGK